MRTVIRGSLIIPFLISSPAPILHPGADLIETPATRPAANPIKTLWTAKCVFGGSCSIKLRFYHYFQVCRIFVTRQPSISPMPNHQSSIKGKGIREA